MGKKRKSVALSPPPPKDSKSESEEEEVEEEDDDFVYEEVEDSSADEEVEEHEEEDEGEDEEEPEENDEEEEDEEEDDESKRETVKKLLQPFGKDQLINFLKEAADANTSIAAEIIKAAESDPIHRKIFVHGLGWDCTNETLMLVFRQYGPIEECNVVTDKATGRSKGYGFVVFKNRAAARKALKQPQKKIGNRMAACQLAAAGSLPNQPASDISKRRLYIANVGPQITVERLRTFFTSFGEIEDGPLGFDKVTGKFRGYAIIVYKTEMGIKKALEEPFKTFEGCKLQCSIALDGRNSKNNASGQAVASAVATNPSVPSVAGVAFAPMNVALPTFPFGWNPGLIPQNMNPGAILMGQNPALGVLNPMLSFGANSSMNQVGMSTPFVVGASQPPNRVGNSPAGVNNISPSVIGSYGSQAALKGLGAYQSSQLSQSSASGAAKANSGIGSAGILPSYYGSR